jgi:hypothetical protein
MIHITTDNHFSRSQNISRIKAGITIRYICRPRIAVPRHNPARNANPKVPRDNTTSELITLRNKRTKQVKKSNAGNSVSAMPTAGQRKGTANSVKPDNNLGGTPGLHFASSRTTPRKQQKFTHRIAGGCKCVIGDSIR